MNPPRSGLLLLNQVTGPLFRELAEDLAASHGGAVLLTDMSHLPPGYHHPSLRLLPGPRYDRRSGLRRLFSWGRYFVRALAVTLTHDRRVCLLLVSNPPFLGWVGWLAARFRGQRYAMLVYDVYPGLLENLGRLPRGGLVAQLWRWSNRVAWGRAEVIFTIGPHMAATIRTMLSPAAAARLQVIPNWADGSRIHPRAAADNPFVQEHGLNGRICVQYSGNLGATHDIGPLLQAAELLGGDPRFVFVIIGGGERWPMVQAEVKARRLTNIKLLPWQPEAVLPYSLAAADVAVITLEAGVEGHSVPSKTYYALAAGAALLVISRGQNELVDLVRIHGCGLSVPAGEAEAVANALRRFADAPDFLACCRAAARRVQEESFSRRNTSVYAAAFPPAASASSGS